MPYTIPTLSDKVKVANFRESVFSSAQKHQENANMLNKQGGAVSEGADIESKMAAALMDFSGRISASKYQDSISRELINEWAEKMENTEYVGSFTVETAKKELTSMFDAAAENRSYAPESGRYR